MQLVALRDRPGIEKRWVARRVVTAILVAIPLWLSILWAQPDSESWGMVGGWTVWCTVAWVAMRGPGRWRASVVGLLYACLLGGLSLWAWRSFQPSLFGTWTTFWTLDVPVMGLMLLKAWAVFRILSMITGLEIADRAIPIEPRWGLRRWFLLMVAIAVLVQSSMAEMNWFAELSVGYTHGSDIGPQQIHPMTQSRNVWLAYHAAQLLTLPSLPILLAAWMLAGKPWRWLMFPVLGAMVVAARAVSHAMVQAALDQAYWLKGLTGGIHKDWTLLGSIEWVAYCFAAILVPWMGFRWTDYWSERTARVSPDPILETPNS